MGKSVVITFMGDTEYKEVPYFLKNKKNVFKTLFVPHAIKHFFFDKQGKKIDEFLIFVTDNKKVKQNANNLRQLIPNAKIIETHIQGEPSINDVMQNLKQYIPKKADLYFDATMGFRSLPIMSILTLNYLEKIHDITIKGLFYGEYRIDIETRQPILSPIHDYTSSLIMNKWAEGIKIYNETGNIKEIKKLKSSYQGPLSEFERLLFNLVEFMEKLDHSIKISNTVSALNAIKNIKAEITKIEQYSLNHYKVTEDELGIEPLIYVLQQVKLNFAEFTDLNQKPYLNIYYLCRYCLEKEHLNQSIIQLREAINKSMEDIRYDAKPEKITTSQSVTHLKRLVPTKLEQVFIELNRHSKKLTKFRNIISHAGNKIYLTPNETDRAVTSDASAYKKIRKEYSAILVKPEVKAYFETIDAQIKHYNISQLKIRLHKDNE